MKWFRLYDEITEDPKMVQLSDQEFRVWILTLCHASKQVVRGCYSSSKSLVSLLKGEMNCKSKSVETALQKLESLGMLKLNHESIQIVNWDKRQYKSDDINEYVKRHRNITRNITEIPPDTDTDTDTDTDNNPPIVPPKGERIPFQEVISYLNEKAKVSFRHTTKTTQQHIRARWIEGHRLEAFQKVVDNMVNAWGTDMKMQQYLRPQTLFGTKFESYLNRKDLDNVEQEGNQRHSRHFLDPDCETSDGS